MNGPAFSTFRRRTVSGLLKEGLFKTSSDDVAIAIARARMEIGKQHKQNWEQVSSILYLDCCKFNCIAPTRVRHW